MANLFWKRKGDKALSLLSTPFSSEEEFEKVIFETKEILEDIFLIKRQVRGGKKPGVPDIVGIDTDGNVCIVEMKNTAVDASVIPQVLDYAFWAETNPDSIKTLWLESPAQPEHVSISFDNYEVRIIVIAPSIDRSTLELVNKINYSVDLIEIKRWVEGQNQWLLVNKLEAEQPKKIKPVHGLGVYDKEFYENNFNKNSVKAFFEYVNETHRLVKSKGWQLELKFNKNYCGFKHGFFNAFGIKWVGSKTFAFFFKLPKHVAASKLRDVKMDRYEDQWKEAVYKIEPGRTSVKKFLPLFQRAFENLTGGSE